MNLKRADLKNPAKLLQRTALPINIKNARDHMNTKIARPGTGVKFNLTRASFKELGNNEISHLRGDVSHSVFNRLKFKVSNGVMSSIYDDSIKCRDVGILTDIDVQNLTRMIQSRMGDGELDSVVLTVNSVDSIMMSGRIHGLNVTGNCMVEFGVLGNGQLDWDNFDADFTGSIIMSRTCKQLYENLNNQSVMGSSSRNDIETKLAAWNQFDSCSVKWEDTD